MVSDAAVHASRSNGVKKRTFETMLQDHDDLDDAEALASSSALSTSRTSGAAKAKREQLRRRAARIGLEKNFFLRQYRDSRNQVKRERKKWEAAQCARGGDALPPPLWRRWPAVHPPRPGKGPRSQPRTYG